MCMCTLCVSVYLCVRVYLCLDNGVHVRVHVATSPCNMMPFDSLIMYIYCHEGGVVSVYTPCLPAKDELLHE